MARIEYSDDEEFTGQFELWQANCDRSVAGIKGQEALRALEHALVTMPVPRLVANTLANAATGEVCAFGALVVAIRVHRGEDRGTVVGEMAGHDPDDPDVTERVARSVGVPHLVAWELVHQNDMNFETRPVYELDGTRRFVDVTPEERHAGILAWVRSKLIEEVPA